MSVFLSSGSPTRSVCSRSFSLSSSASNTGSCTSSRDPAQQTWPWLKKMPLTTPSTAWSSGASSNTMFAALPPSSSVRRFPLPAVARRMILPTSVEPVKAILSTSASTSAAPVSPAPVTMFTTPGGSSASWITSASRSAVSGVVSAGFSTTVLPGGERRGELPRGHQQREVPRDDLAGHAERPGRAPGERVLELVGPPRVVEEVRGRERQVDVARLLDRLAAVHRLEHGELARALLELARDAVDVLRALAAGEGLPGAGRRAGSLDGERHVLDARLGDLGERLLGRRVDRREPPAALRLDELPADEQPVAVLEPHDVRRLGRGRVRPRPTRWCSIASLIRSALSRS